MRSRILQRQEGQALIQVTLSIMLLLAMLILAVDVGHVYAERRQMQNAADAGALAGARERCLGSDTATAQAVAQDYAINRNGAQEADVTFEGEGQNIVRVVARETTNTFFAGIFGFETADVAAEAAAQCGATTRACGIWPIAFELSEWNRIVTATCSEGQTYASDPFWVFDGEQEVDCTKYDCDFDDDGQSDVISGPHRAWMDFSTAINDPNYVDPCTNNASGCGTSELSCRVVEDHNPPLTIPGCVGGSPGARQDLFTPPNSSELDSRVGDLVRIPLYSGYCGAGSGACTGSYYVEELGCVEVIDIQRHINVAGPSEPPEWRDAIVVQARCDCSTNCGNSSGGTPGAGEVSGVSLIR